MTQFKEKAKPPQIWKTKPHDEAELKILEIRDADGVSMIGREFDPRLFAEKDGKKCKIKYELKNQPVIVSITIEPAPGNTVAKKYYGKTPAWTYMESVAAGTHTVEWDGRSEIEGSRLLLAGDYKVTAGYTCICGEHYTEVKDIRVKKPYADTYGALFPGTEGDKRPPADWARNALKSLSDGSGFECGGSATATANNALPRMRFFSAAWYWGGHAGPGKVVFVDAAMNKTRVCSTPAAAAGFPGAVAAVDALPDGALNDVFLVVLRGCKTAGSTGGVPGLPGALVGKGADLALGFMESLPGDVPLQWTQAFFGAMIDGKTVGHAALDARDTVGRNADYKKAFKPTVSAGGGASVRDTLIPARYGRKKG